MANRSDLRDDIESDLGTSGNAEYSDAEMNRAIDRAVADLSRVLPKKNFKDVTNDWTVTDESVTSPSSDSSDVKATLDNKFITPGTEVLTNSAGTITYTVDTDYVMDYINGTFYTLSTGTIANNVAHKIDYDRFKVVVKIDDITAGMLRINKIEHNPGVTPQEQPDFEVYGDYLFVTSKVPVDRDDTHSQEVMADKSHVWIYYDEIHTSPADSANGSYPTILDEVVLKGAEYYLIYAKAMKQFYLAETEIGLANTALDKIDRQMLTKGGDSAAAIDGINNLAATGTGELALADIAFDLVPAILAEVDTTDLVAAEAVWAKEDAWLTTGSGDGTTGLTDAHVEDHLDVGTDLINTINTGERAAALRADFARVAVDAALVYDQRWKNNLAQAQVRLGQARGNIESGQGRLASAQIRLGFVEGKVAIAGAFIRESDGRLVTADRYLQLAQFYLEQALVTREEFFTTLRDRLSIMGNLSSMPRAGQ